MSPLAIIHHLVCRWHDWHSGLAQPGTFFFIVVLNSLLWARAGHWLARRFAATSAAPRD